MCFAISIFFFFFSSRRRHTRYIGDWSSDVCSSDLTIATAAQTDFNVQVQLQEAVEAALQTSWTNPVYDVTLVLTPTSIVNA